MRSPEEGFSPGYGGEAKTRLEGAIRPACRGVADLKARPVPYPAGDQFAFITATRYRVDERMAAL